MCEEIYFVQFPEILATDTDVIVNSATYPSGDSVRDLVSNNPQFWFAPGIAGIKTLWTLVYEPTIDIVMTVNRNGSTVTTPGAFVKGRPVGR